MSPPNDNVLFVPSRNVLLTGAGLRGGFRNTSHDATGPRPAGRIEESQEGTDHPTAGGRGDRPERAACSPAAEAAEGPRRRNVGARFAGPTIQPPAGRENEGEGAGDLAPRRLSRIWPNVGSGISGPEARYPCRARNGAGVDDRRQIMASQ